MADHEKLCEDLKAAFERVLGTEYAEALRALRFKLGQELPEFAETLKAPLSELQAVESGKPQRPVPDTEKRFREVLAERGLTRYCFFGKDEASQPCTRGDLEELKTLISSLQETVKDLAETVKSLSGT